MKRIAFISIVTTLILGVIITSCNGDEGNRGGGTGDGSGTSPTNSNSTPTETTEPTVLSQQTKVVLAEMFTGDW